MHHSLKTKKDYKNLKEQEIEDIYIYRNELGKACFQDDMVYRCFKHLTGRTASDKALHDKMFNIVKNSKYMWILTWNCINCL